MARDKQSEAIRTGINPVVEARVSGAIAPRGSKPEGFADEWDAWFGPQAPLDPMAPVGTEGRRFDYQTGSNMNYTPRREQSETPITFDVLRRIAEPAAGGLDLLRLAIETRKDQMAAQQWTIQGRGKLEGGARAAAIEQRLRRPDGVTPFQQWQRMLVEDQLVLDAMVVYYNPGGPEILAEPVDGGTIKRLLDGSGRVPRPPLPAYQQVIKGVPAVNYTLEEMTYWIRNPRTNRVYGCSPVEQVIGIVNLALRRQLHVTQYFTEGNVPEVLIGVPEGWGPDQIRDFQGWWDGLLEGDTGQRRHAKFVPGGMEPYPTKDPELKGELDDWLSRIICYAFSLPPESLVRAVNRATAQTSKESSQETGLEPFKTTWKDFMDEVLERAFQAPDLEFRYSEEEIGDPAVKATVLSTYVGKKPILTVDEARDELGYKAATPEQLDELRPPPPPALGVPDGGPDSGPGLELDPAAEDDETARTAKVAAALATRIVRKKASRQSTETGRLPHVPAAS